MNRKQVIEFPEQWCKPMRLLKFLVRSVLAIALASVAAQANAQSIDDLYQAAKKEGALSLNGGGAADFYEPWVREFEQRFPGIKVKLTADFSNILAPVIDREIAERKLSVDLTIFQTLQDYDRWKKQRMLMSKTISAIFFAWRKRSRWRLTSFTVSTLASWPTSMASRCASAMTLGCKL
jgi:hypothetical protein